MGWSLSELAEKIALAAIRTGKDAVRLDEISKEAEADSREDLERAARSRMATAHRLKRMAANVAPRIRRSDRN